MAAKMNDDLLWRQYALHVDLYKFYIDASVKISAFHYAITGAILSFYFTRSDVALAKWSLILPLVLSCGLGWLFWYGAGLLNITREDVFAIRDRLGLDTAPEFRVLGAFLRLMSGVYVLTALAMLALVVLR